MLIKTLLPFVLLLALAGGWTVIMARLLQRLALYEPRAYAALGSPVMRGWWWQVPRGLREEDPVRRAPASRPVGAPGFGAPGNTLLAFVAAGRHRALRDAECRRLGDYLRTILALFPLGLLGFAVLTLQPAP